MFHAFDANGDGHISVEEFQTTLAAIGVCLPAHMFDAVVSYIDIDGDRHISFIELVEALERARRIKRHKNETARDDLVAGKPTDCHVTQSVKLEKSRAVAKSVAIAASQGWVAARNARAAPPAATGEEELECRVNDFAQIQFSATHCAATTRKSHAAA